jgi:hypothetical protein
VLAAVVGKLVVREGRAGNDVGSHRDPYAFTRARIPCM